jgi:hypothetical protein
MTVDVLPISAPGAPPLTTAREPASFDARWATWRAKGAARDRAVRRRMAVLAPVLIVLAAVIVYALVGR